MIRFASFEPFGGKIIALNAGVVERLTVEADGGYTLLQEILLVQAVLLHKKRERICFL